VLVLGLSERNLNQENGSRWVACTSKDLRVDQGSFALEGSELAGSSASEYIANREMSVFFGRELDFDAIILVSVVYLWLQGYLV
jgi:hypothetical protein